MTRRMVSFQLDEELIAGLKGIQDRDGINASEQMRRAIRAWLSERGAKIEKGGGRKKKKK